MNFLAELSVLRAKFDFRLYSYCLMPNHIHLIMGPGESEDLPRFNLGLAELVGRRTTIGREHPSIATHIVPIHSDEVLLATARYHDLNAVHAGIVRQPEAFEWSSYRFRVGLSVSPRMDLDPGFLALGETSERRQMEYREFVRHRLCRPKRVRGRAAGW
jgi:putative transposase